MEKKVNVFAGTIARGFLSVEPRVIKFELNERRKEFGLDIRYIPRDFKLNGIILCQLENTEFERSMLPISYIRGGMPLADPSIMVAFCCENSGYSQKPIMYLADYDYEELRDAAEASEDYVLSSKPKSDFSPNRYHKLPSYHDFVPMLRDKYGLGYIQKLKDMNLNVTYLFADYENQSISVLKLGNASNLYYGYTGCTNEIFFSNDSNVVGKFCPEVIEISTDCYYENGSFYDITETEEKGKVVLQKVKNRK